MRVRCFIEVLQIFYFSLKKAAVIGAGYAILEPFADPMRVPKKLLEKSRLLESYDRMSPQAFRA